MQKDKVISYKLLFSKRRTISIIISPYNGVIVKAPLRTPARTIDKFITDKSGWITKTLNGFSSLKRFDNVNGYRDGDTVLLFGKEHILNIVRSDKNSVRLVDDKIIKVSFKDDNDPLLIRAILEEWFKSVAKTILAKRFREILDRYNNYGFRPSGFTVRTMKKRWGSCSSKGKIAISYDLIRLDEKFSEYVLIHELCHLTHHNHSQQYYRFLGELYPDWKKTREELRRYIR